MMVASEAEEAWWPPTLSPSRSRAGGWRGGSSSSRATAPCARARRGCAARRRRFQPASCPPWWKLTLPALIESSVAGAGQVYHVPWCAFDDPRNSLAGVIPGRPRRQVYAACVNLAACGEPGIHTPRSWLWIPARATQVGYSRLGQFNRRSQVNPRSVARPGMTGRLNRARLSPPGSPWPTAWRRRRTAWRPRSSSSRSDPSSACCGCFRRSPGCSRPRRRPC